MAYNASTLMSQSGRYASTSAIVAVVLTGIVHLTKFAEPRPSLLAAFYMRNIMSAIARDLTRLMLAIGRGKRANLT